MRDEQQLQQFLASVAVDDAVFELRSDYRAVMVAADGLQPADSDDVSDTALQVAERSAIDLLAERPVEEVPQVAAWRDAYRAFGAKPQRTRNSLEALLRRASSGLPRVNRLTDLYNAISVQHLLPLGGEDLDRYRGAARLVRANGTEPFDAAWNGEPVVEHPEAGEVVWRDDAGVTCRRWNWRQGTRTRLTDTTTAVLFIIDVLDPVTDQDADAAARHLIAELAALGPAVSTATRTIRHRSVS